MVSSVSLPFNLPEHCHQGHLYIIMMNISQFNDTKKRLRDPYLHVFFLGIFMFYVFKSPIVNDAIFIANPSGSMFLRSNWASQSQISGNRISVEFAHSHQAHRSLLVLLLSTLKSKTLRVMWRWAMVQGDPPPFFLNTAQCADWVVSFPSNQTSWDLS